MNKNTDDFKSKVLAGTSGMRKKGFQLKECVDKGMHKYALLTNGKIDFGFSYDRGYIECLIEIGDNKYFELIRLLNFLYQDKNAFKTISDSVREEDEIISHYEKFIISEYELLSKFILNVAENDYIEYEEWSTLISAQLWEKKLKEKGIPIPESLKKRLK